MTFSCSADSGSAESTRSSTAAIDKCDDNTCKDPNTKKDAPPPVQTPPQAPLACTHRDGPIDLTMCITGSLGNGCETRDQLRKEVIDQCARDGTNGVFGLEATTVKFDDSHACKTDSGADGVPSVLFSCCVPGT